MLEELLERFNKLYPDKMILEDMNEFDRVKLIGKVELLYEIKEFIEEEFGKVNVIG